MRISVRKGSGNSDQPPEQKALEAKIDAMMQPERAKPADKPATTPDVSPASSSAPAIDIFKDTVTAPAVPKDLLKKIGDAKAAPSATTPQPPASKPAAPPLDEAAKAPLPVTDEANIDDEATDKAVDDIAASDSDELLAHQDAAGKKSDSIVVSKTPFRQKLINLLRNKWTWIILAVLLIAVFAVPMTRYKLLGLVIKKSFTISVVDSKTNTPVSSAEINLAGRQAKTDANGKVTLTVPIGPDNLQITKQYYTTYNQKVFVGFKSAGANVIKLVATGRQVPVKVINSITGKPLAGVTINVLSTSAKTDVNGMATIVLPTKETSDKATISASGYNDKAVTVTVTADLSPLNTFNLTPAGKIYFLSNLSGKIDVVKANLDGTGRATVLAGTGTEDPNTTSLLASRDWNFLVLKAQRNGNQPALYLIDTSNDKVTQFDNGNLNFNLIGWYGHNFVYDAVSNTLQPWQSGHEILKSYNADSGTLNQLDQSQGEGLAGDYAYQSFANFYILDNDVAYTTQWYGYNSGGSYDLSGKNDTVRMVQPGGQNKKDYQTWPASTTGGIAAVLSAPQSIYYAVYDNTNSTTTYYEMNNQTVSQDSNLSQATFSQPYPTFLLSPSGAQTFWAELRDGKNTLFTGDKNAKNGQQLATLSDYSPYGWYGDSYLLVSRDNSELYIIPASGFSNNQQPLKITDYYKPATTYSGYGYGYGGL